MGPMHNGGRSARVYSVWLTTAHHLTAALALFNKLLSCAALTTAARKLVMQSRCMLQLT
jgi:hypothetical protein